MSDSFDPYRVWLGIPPESRPPTHYELLGISPNEQEKSVIEAAVLRQSGYVRNFQIGKYAKEAARVLNEIGAAKACLLDRVKRAKYDSKLTASQPAAAAAAYQVAPADDLPPAIDIGQLGSELSPPQGDILSEVVASARPFAATRLRGRPRRGATLNKRPRLSWQPLAGFGIGVALTLAIVALWPTRIERASTDAGPTFPLAGTVYAEAASVASAPSLDRSAHGELSVAPASGAVAPPSESAPTPRVLQTMTETQFIRNVARDEDGSFFVGMGEHWYGMAAVGYELENARRVVLELKVTGELRKQDGRPFGGFVIDYHTPAGYTHRVALSIGPFHEPRDWPAPEWGKRAPDDRIVDLGPEFAFNDAKYREEYADVAEHFAPGSSTKDDMLRHWQLYGKYEGRHAMFGPTDRHELNLGDWAPAGWDGKAWFSAVLTNSGAGSGFEGKLTEPASPLRAKLPGEYRRLTGHTDSVAALAFLPNGQLLSGSFDTTWATWDTQVGIAVQRFATEVGNETAVRAVAASSDGKTALISNVNRINHVELPTGNLLHRSYGHAEGVRCLAMSADRHRAVSGGVDSRARFWDLDTGQQIWERPTPGWVHSVAISPDGNRVFLGTDGKEGGLIRVLDAAGNQISSITVGAGAVIGISLSPDGKRCLASQGPAIKLWDLESSVELAQFDVARGGGSRPVFSPDGRYAAWGGDEGFVSLWDIEKREMLAEFEHAPLGSHKGRRHAHDWTPVAFSPDGKLLASGASDGTIYLWNVPDPPAEVRAND